MSADVGNGGTANHIDEIKTEGIIYSQCRTQSNGSALTRPVAVVERSRTILPMCFSLYKHRPMCSGKKRPLLGESCWNYPNLDPIAA
jgi:hypothetical protein